MEIGLVTWGVIMLICVLEACFYSQLDPESKKLMKDRENESKNKDLHK
jgi:hypothetical protein